MPADLSITIFHRECWPGENQFGRKNISAEEEFMCARTIFFKEMPSKFFSRFL